MPPPRRNALSHSKPRSNGPKRNKPLHQKNSSICSSPSDAMQLDSIANYPIKDKFRRQELLAVKGKVVTVLSPAKLTALLRRNLGE